MNAYDYSQYELEPHKLETPADRYSDDEEEYNYYTDEDDEDSDEEGAGHNDDLQGYFRLRALMAMMFPLTVSASIGMFLARKQLESRQK